MTDFPDRHTYLGASEVAAALGYSPYQTPLDLWRNKREKKEIESNDAMEWGRILEPIVISVYEMRRNVSIIQKQQLYQNEESGTIRCHLDGFDNEISSIIEVKTARFWREEIPLHYQIQAHIQMALTGYDKVRFVVLSNTNEYRDDQYVYRSDDTLNWLKAAEIWWQKYMIEDEEPKPINYVDATKIPSNGKIIEATPDLLTLHQEYLETNHQMRTLKKYLDSLKERFALAMNDFEEIQSDGRTIASFKAPKQRSVIDWEGLAREYHRTFGRNQSFEDDITKHTQSVKPNRVLRIKT